MAITILLCYAQDDEDMVRRLKNHLSLLERNGVIELWGYGNISAGSEWETETNKHLDDAQIILLLISASFFASEYCFSLEMRAMERHTRRETRVIPVILRPVRWKEPPLDKLQPLPGEGKPVLKWHNSDEGFENVADGIVKVIEQLQAGSFPDRRKTLIANLDQLIEAVKSHMQPPPRAIATAHTLQQLSLFIPDDVTLADLIAGWSLLAHSSKQGEEPAIAQRRVTCGELARLAAPFTTGNGNVAQATKTWNIWAEAFKKSDDPRQAAMGRTFARELAELQAAAH